MEADSTDSASIRSLVLVVVVAEIDAYVEVVVIPIRFMVPAPLPGCIHPGDVVFDLAAVFAVAADIAVDSGAIRFQPAVTILFPILIRASGTAESEYKSAGQCHSQNHPTQHFLARHVCLRGLDSARGPRPFSALFVSTGRGGELSGQGCSLRG